MRVQANVTVMRVRRQWFAGRADEGTGLVVWTPWFRAALTWW